MEDNKLDFKDFVIEKFWPKDGFFEDELTAKLCDIRKKTNAMFEDDKDKGKKLIGFFTERIKQYYDIENRPKIKSYKILREFNKGCVEFCEYEITLFNDRKTAVITAKKTGTEPEKAVIGLHGTNGDREYYLDVLSHPPRNRPGHKSTIGFLLPLVEAGFLVVCPDLPCYGRDYPGETFEDDTFSNNITKVDTLSRLSGFSYINETVYRLMAVNDFLSSSEFGNIKKIGVTGFSLGGQAAVCLGACDARIGSVLEYMGISTYERFLKNSPEKINRSTYIYGSGVLEGIGDVWAFAAALFPRNYKKVICTKDIYIDYEAAKDICGMMGVLYKKGSNVFEYEEYPLMHILNRKMSLNTVEWFEKTL